MADFIAKVIIPATAISEEIHLIALDNTGLNSGQIATKFDDYATNLNKAVNEIDLDEPCALSIPWWLSQSLSLIKTHIEKRGNTTVIITTITNP